MFSCSTFKMKPALLWIAVLSSPLIVSSEAQKLEKLSAYDFSEEELDACRSAIQIYASSLSAYKNCTISSLHPSSMCIKCRSLYIDAGDAFSYLDQINSVRKNVTCKDLYISNSALNKDSKFVRSSFGDAVKQSSEFSQAKCHKCYQDEDVWGGNLKDGLAEFLKAYDQLSRCYREFYNSEGDHGPDHPLCKTCRKDFDSFTNLYLQKLSPNRTGLRFLSKTCLDVMDRVLLANKVFDDLNCRITHPISNTMFAIVIASIIAPFTFYLPFIYKCLTEGKKLSEGDVHASLVNDGNNAGNQASANREPSVREVAENSSEEEFGQ